MEQIVGAINPISFQIGPLQVRWYGVIIGIAMYMAAWLSSREAEKRGIKEDTIADLTMWVIPVGLIGARLYYVLFELDYYLQNPSDILAIWEGGIAIYGGLIAGFFTVVWFSRKRETPLGLMLDVLAPSVLLAQAIGRWGNFMNQEAHGREVSRQFLENLALPEFLINQMEIGGVYYHPTFLYESLWSILGVAVLLLLRNREHVLRRGEVALSYVLWYSFGRFFIEGMRTDSLYLGGTGIRISQVVSLLLFVGAVILFLYRRANIYPPLPYYAEGMQPEVRMRKRQQAKVKTTQ
ncbi:prolipoprotein diacylglyceryl transferase [Trichococcus shcherbakoviae]|uniref:Phosphatidylglycerol--prolipoprotein diacylglyceryl transferase n=1 Tax=Trichococcus shcherbakoviae TaxID=2094020 RepID=A0A383THB6_9LACT|nr:prolipoprotein diacylglyceryl transferase [Trichococcus shcherbakoviae]SYZ79336.1 prolipoprotein diacylglyceryl transferase [Trichococcus shcherbakoviae]